MLFVDYRASQGISFIVFRTMYNLAFLSKHRLFQYAFYLGLLLDRREYLRSLSLNITVWKKNENAMQFILMT